VFVCVCVCVYVCVIEKRADTECAVDDRLTESESRYFHRRGVYTRLFSSLLFSSLIFLLSSSLPSSSLLSCPFLFSSLHIPIPHPLPHHSSSLPHLLPPHSSSPLSTSLPLIFSHFSSAILPLLLSSLAPPTHLPLHS